MPDNLVAYLAAGTHRYCLKIMIRCKFQYAHFNFYVYLSYVKVEKDIVEYVSIFKLDINLWKTYDGQGGNGKFALQLILNNHGYNNCLSSCRFFTYLSRVKLNTKEFRWIQSIYFQISISIQLMHKASLAGFFLQYYRLVYSYMNISCFIEQHFADMCWKIVPYIICSKHH